MNARVERRFRMPWVSWLGRDMRALASIAFLLTLAVVSLLAPVLAPYSPTTQDLDSLLLPPSAEHLLGTDDLGRDVFSRLLHGSSTSLFASLLAVGVGCAIGLPTGLIAGFMPGRIDDLISRIIDTMLAFPAFILAIAVTGVLGFGLVNSMVAVGIVFSPQIARLARAQARLVKGELYVDAATSFGASRARILVQHIIPNAIQPVIVQVTLLLAVALLAEASLSFLGLGVQPPNPSWGTMLARAYQYIEIAPEQMYAPGIAIMLTALAFNALGESLRTAMDPTMRHR